MKKTKTNNKIAVILMVLLMSLTLTLSASAKSVGKQVPEQQYTKANTSMQILNNVAEVSEESSLSTNSEKADLKSETPKKEVELKEPSANSEEKTKESSGEEVEKSKESKSTNTPYYVGAGFAVAILGGVVAFCKMYQNKRKGGF